MENVIELLYNKGNKPPANIAGYATSKRVRVIKPMLSGDHYFLTIRERGDGDSSEAVS